MGSGLGERAGLTRRRFLRERAVLKCREAGRELNENLCWGLQGPQTPPGPGAVYEGESHETEFIY